MDWNFDGKVDEKDDAFFLEVISKEEKSEKTTKQPKRITNSIRLTGLGKVVLWILVALVIMCIFTGGSLEVAFNLAEIGFLVFLFAQWLDS